MEASVEGSEDPLAVSSPSHYSPSSSGRFGVQFPALDFFQAPLSVLLEYSGIVTPTESLNHPAQPIPPNADPIQTQLPNCPPDPHVSARRDGEVSIRIIGANEGCYFSCSFS